MTSKERQLRKLVRRAQKVLQHHVLPEHGPSDHEAMQERYSIFDSDEAYEAMKPEKRRLEHPMRSKNGHSRHHCL